MLQEGVVMRQELIDLWKRQKFDELRYSVIIHKLFIPIAAAFAFSIPPRSAKLMMLTVLPNETGTIVILAGFKNCIFSNQLIDEFEALGREEQDEWITTLLLTRGEVNTHFSPNLFTAMDEDEFKQFMELLNHYSYSMNRPNFFHYIGNLFEQRFARHPEEN
jgi:hypothetical protein